MPVTRQLSGDTKKQTRQAVCSLCEAGCGLLIEFEDGAPVTVRANPDDAVSLGHVCPKGLQIANLDADPDRLRAPMRRRPDGSFRICSWEEAYAEVADRIKGIQSAHGRDAFALYMGTISVHKYDVLLMRNALLGALKTRNVSSAGSQDTTPRFAASHFTFGSAMTVPVPDIDRTDFFLCLGGNPVVSNGSMMTAPGVKRRLLAIQERGGRIVVVDPRRTATAQLADEYVSIRPGSDAALLLSMAEVLVRRELVDGQQIALVSDGFERVCDELHAFSPSRVQHFTDVPAATIERLAIDFARAPSSVAYCRMGPTNARFGTLTCFAIDLLNILAGRLGKKGGAMFATPAIDVPSLARLIGAEGFDRYRSRVRGLPETLLDLPATTLAEEIETPGTGQIRGLMTFAGNPVLSVPNGRRLEKALSQLDFMVSIDVYINETTRHADIILPPGPMLADEYLDLFFANTAVRNGIRWMKPPTTSDAPADWEIMQELVRRLGGGPTAIPPVDAALRVLGIKVPPSLIADIFLRMGPYGDHFFPFGGGLNRKKVQAEPNGFDLGPLQPGFRRHVRHARRRLRLAQKPLLEEMRALAAELGRGVPKRLQLIGRREIRSNNSWMHNIPSLMTGKPRCVLYVHPSDAEQRGLKDGSRAILHNKIHEGEVLIHITDEIRSGVVSLPHGYGHFRAGTNLRIASQHAGASINDWIDDSTVETITGQSILNGAFVELSPLATGRDGTA